MSVNVGEIMQNWMLGCILLAACGGGTLAFDPDVEDTDISGEDTGEAMDTDNTDEKPLLQESDLLGHLNALQTIANDHDGNRSVGTSGYDASVEYVYTTLLDWGLTPERHPFEVRRYTPRGATLRVPGLMLTEDEDYTLMWYSPGAETQAPVHAVDLMLPPGSSPNSSTSGCESDDFAEFPEGHIALIQRGSCTYEQKAQNASAAGASGVIIFNEGQSGRRDLVGGALSNRHEGSIPVIFTTFELGEQLVDIPAEISLQTDAETVTLMQDNVVATIAGESDTEWVIGAHLDSVPDGPGINDNGTGVAVVLEMARWLSMQDAKDSITVAFWGAEEIGLVGSTAYAQALSEPDVRQIGGYLNLDMVGSPNAGRFVYAGDRAIADDAPGTEALQDALTHYFDSQELSWASTEVGGRSDHAGFVARGIPSGGYFTGAEGTKTNGEAEQWGGTANQSYDACYHRACDTLENVNVSALVEMALATQETVHQLVDGVPESNADRTPWTEIKPNLGTTCGGHHKPVE